MAYINFKEERFVARNQLEQRKKNNEKLFNYIIRKKELGTGYNPCKEYSYTTFTDKEFGKKGILDEDKFSTIESKDIICAKFIGCTFTNIKFKECRFVACVFEDCKFEQGGVSFENCSFLKEDSDIKPSLNRKDNLSCIFKDCTIYGRFLNCILGFSIFENTIIQNTNFEQSDMDSAIIIDCELNKVTISDCDLSGFKVVNTYIIDIDFKDKYSSKLDEKSFIDKIPVRYKTREEYEGIYMTYETIADKFEENSLKNNFGEYFYLCKCAQRKTLKIIPKIESSIYWITCGYGERPLYTVITSIVLIVVFALIYLVVGVKIDEQTVIYNWSRISNFKFREFMTHFNEALSLSFGTFGGVGDINCDPLPQSYIISNIEIIFGVTMTGIGTGALVRKIVR